jgi:hypothetical protein
MTDSNSLVEYLHQYINTDLLDFSRPITRANAFAAIHLSKFRDITPLEAYRKIDEQIIGLFIIYDNIYDNNDLNNIIYDNIYDNNNLNNVTIFINHKLAQELNITIPLAEVSYQNRLNGYYYAERGNCKDRDLEIKLLYDSLTSTDIDPSKKEEIISSLKQWGSNLQLYGGGSPI